MSSSQVSSTKHIVDIQPKYGVDHTQIQLKYGPLVPQIQPAYGVSLIGTGDLNVTYEQLEENIATLKKAINSLKNSWGTETNKNLATIENSWVGNDCKEYTEKLRNMDKKVTNTISALELLCSTYEKARDMVQQNETKAISSIQNIN